MPIKAVSAGRVLDVLRPGEMEQAGYLTGIFRGDPGGGVDEEGSMNECGFCRNHCEGDGNITTYVCDTCINVFCDGCLRERSYVVPSSDPEEPWSCPLCVRAKSEERSEALLNVLTLSQREASTRVAAHPVAGVQSVAVAAPARPKKKKRRRAAPGGAPTARAKRHLGPKEWQTSLLDSLHNKDWPSTFELGLLPAKLPSAFRDADARGYVVLAPTSVYFDRLDVPTAERPQATRLLNHVVKLTGLLNTADIEGPHIHRQLRVGTGAPKPYYRLSMEAQTALSKAAAKVRDSVPSKTTLLQFAKHLARDAPSPRDLHGAGFEHCPLCDMPVLALDDPRLDEKRAAITSTVAGTTTDACTELCACENHGV